MSQPLVSAAAYSHGTAAHALVARPVHSSMVWAGPAACDWLRSCNDFQGGPDVQSAAPADISVDRSRHGCRRDIGAGESRRRDRFLHRPAINWIVSYGPGGSYGLYAQLAARHIGKHLPGNPNIVVQFMPGAGGILATNHLYTAAPKDGSTIATVTKDLALEQALRPSESRYDARQFSWVGSFAEYIAVFAVWTQSGIKSIADAKTREVSLATSGRGHQGRSLRCCSMSTPAPSSSWSPAIAARPT